MPEYLPYSDELDEDLEPVITCILCRCIIGDEVGYGDNWGEGPICDNCIGHIDAET